MKEKTKESILKYIVLPFAIITGLSMAFMLYWACKIAMYFLGVSLL